MSAFTRAEYLARIGRAKRRMVELDLDLLFITVPENINYLCGYAGWSFYTTQALLLTPAMEEPVLVVRDMDVACATFSAFLSPENAIGYPEEYIGGDKHAMTFIAQVIRERCPSLRRVGYEAEAPFLNIATWQRLKAEVAPAELVDMQRMINWLRTVKTPAEVQTMREAAEISRLAIEAAHEMIVPGMRECDLAGELKSVLIKGTPEYGGTPPDNPLLSSGSRTSTPHIAWTDARMEKNSAVMLELGGSRHHYHAGLSRTWFLGTPPASLVRLAAITTEGLNSALEVVRPGVHCQDIEAAWRRVITRAGYEKKSRIGYSIGLGFQPNWADETASLQAGDMTVLEPGMTFHLICGMWKGADNFLLSETFTVTPNGCEVLTQSPRQLLVKS